MASVTTDINQTRAVRIAQRRIQGFAQEFGEAHRNLACHAAFPLVLTPDLLYQIWANFVPQAPWTAVAHVLLSRLCRQVGYEIYEMDITDRNLLLRELKVQYGQERFDELGDFLLDYVAQRLTDDDVDTQDLREAQEWTALAYTKPLEAARQLAQVLSQRVEQENIGEVLRLVSVMETLAQPLIEAEFEPLLIYQKAMESFAHGDFEDAINLIKPLLDEQQQLIISGVHLSIPEQMLNSTEQIKSSKELSTAPTLPNTSASEHINVQSVFGSTQQNTIVTQTPSSQYNSDSRILDLDRLYQACNPSKPLMLENALDKSYYIDFASVRGGKIIEALSRTIIRISPDTPTCQMFTGHIGCGKSTELWRLKAELEQAGFHVVYIESTQVLDVVDFDVTDILIAIAGQVSESLEEINIVLKPGYLAKLFGEIVDFLLQTPLDLELQGKLSVNIAKITAKTKESPQLRRRLRDYLEPRTENILNSINTELLARAESELKAKGKKGLVVIVDNLDRVDIRPLPSGRSLPEHLFIDRGEQLSKLNCHVVYTIPLALTFSNDSVHLQQRLGGGVRPKVLPMIPVRKRTGEINGAGLSLMRQMVLARAFPDIPVGDRLERIHEVFDSQETLDRLCLISGGHLRDLLGLLFTCVREQDPPFDRECVEMVIRRHCDSRANPIDSEEWDLIFQVVKEQKVKGDIEYQQLIRSLFVFEYRDSQGAWFAINPVLAETQKFRSWLEKIGLQEKRV